MFHCPLPIFLNKFICEAYDAKNRLFNILIRVGIIMATGLPRQQVGSLAASAQSCYLNESR